MSKSLPHSPVSGTVFAVPCDCRTFSGQVNNHLTHNLQALDAAYGPALDRIALSLTANVLSHKSRALMRLRRISRLAVRNARRTFPFERYPKSPRCVEHRAAFVGISKLDARAQHL